MGGTVGGTPEQINSGGAQLATAALAVGACHVGIDQAGSTGSAAAAEGPLVASISRFAAAYSELTADLDTQLRAAGLLATNAAEDLTVAGGGGRRPPAAGELRSGALRATPPTGALTQGRPPSASRPSRGPARPGADGTG